MTTGTIAAPREPTRLSRSEASRVVWGLAAPTLVEMFLVSLTGMADMMQCGRLGPAAITGIGLTNQPMFLLQAVFLAVNVGTTAVVARFIGMRRADRASEVLRQTIVVTLPLGVLTSIFAGVFVSKFLVFMGADAEVVRVGLALGVVFVLAGNYIELLYTNDPVVILSSALILRIYAVAQPFQSTQFILAGGLRGAGDTTYPLYSTAIGIWAGRVIVGYAFGTSSVGGSSAPGWRWASTRLRAPPSSGCGSAAGNGSTLRLGAEDNVPTS